MVDLAEELDQALRPLHGPLVRIGKGNSEDFCQLELGRAECVENGVLIWRGAWPSNLQIQELELWRRSMGWVVICAAIVEGKGDEM